MTWTIDDVMKPGWQVPPATHTCDRCGEGTWRAGICGECERRAEAAAEQRRQVRERLEVIPARYRDASFARPELLAARVADARAIDAVRGSLGRHQVVVLLGPPGAGKSTLAAALAADEATAGRSLAWAPALRLACARSEAKLGEEPAEVRAAIRAGVTVVDDLGQEGLTTMSAIVDVVHARHDGQRPIIVTSGLSRRDLGTRYGGGCGRRLLEHAMVVEMAARRGS